MTRVRFETDSAANADLQIQVLRVFVRAGAMGLLSTSEVTVFSDRSIKQLLEDLSSHGFGLLARAAFQPLATRSLVHTPPPEAQRLAAIAADLADALERTPVPDTEWPAMRATMADDAALGALLQVGPSSLRRYAESSRPTPPDVAARLHFLALVTSDLRGSYNDDGCAWRGWWSRPHPQLGNRTPAQTLGRRWSAHGPEADRVRRASATLWALAARLGD